MTAAPDPAPTPPTRSTLNLPFLVGVALVCGFGLFSMTQWMVTQSWLWFGLAVPAIFLGGLLLFHRGTGSEMA